MTNFVGVDVQTGYVEVVKYVETGVITEIYSCSVPDTLALNDTITGPSIPAGCTLLDVMVDVPDLDSSTGIVFSVGIAGSTAKFITGSTTAQAGGVQRANVAGTVGYTPTSNTPVFATITTAATGTKAAGSFVIAITYTASP
jgi:hypothetical protein